MKTKPDSFSLVIVGHWNRHIFSPRWVASKIFKEPNVNIEIGLEDINLPPRFTSTEKKIRFIPTEEKLIFFALSSDNDTLKKIEEMALIIVDLLPHTPLTGFGVNFGYSENDEVELYNIFDLKDNARLGSFECEIIRNSIKRQIKYKNINFNLTITKQNKDIKFDFNFHYKVNAAEQVKEKIQGVFISNRQIAEQLLKDVYELELEIPDGGEQ